MVETFGSCSNLSLDFNQCINGTKKNIVSSIVDIAMTNFTVTRNIHQFIRKMLFTHLKWEKSHKNEKFYYNLFDKCHLHSLIKILYLLSYTVCYMSRILQLMSEMIKPILKYEICH